MTRRTALALALSTLAFGPGAAVAQLAPPGAPTPVPPEPAPAVAPAPAPGDAAAKPPDDPQLPGIEDPMLEPVPAANRVLASWRQALTLVRTRSTGLRISRAQIEQARGQARQVLALALPQLNASASVNRHLLFGTGLNFGSEGVVQNATIPDPSTVFNAGLQFRQPLFALGTWHAIGTAKRATEATALSARDTERLLFATVAEAAVSVVTAERVAETTRVALSSALSTLDLTQRRALLGAASAVDVLRAKQEVAFSRAQVVAAIDAVHRTREALGFTLGYAEPWGVSDAVDAADLRRTAERICRIVPIETRSDVRAAAMGVEIAERNETGVDYRYAPNLDLVSSLDYQGNANRSANGEHVTWTVGAVLSWPLFDGGERYGDRKRTEAETQIAREQLTDRKRTANLEILQADRAVRVAQANIDVSTKSRDVAKESARLAKIAFINGSGTSFDLVDTASRHREAEIDLAIREFELIQARISAYLAKADCGI